MSPKPTTVGTRVRNAHGELARRAENRTGTARRRNRALFPATKGPGTTTHVRGERETPVRYSGAKYVRRVARFLAHCRRVGHQPEPPPRSSRPSSAGAYARKFRPTRRPEAKRSARCTVYLKKKRKNSKRILCLKICFLLITDACFCNTVVDFSSSK